MPRGLQIRRPQGADNRATKPGAVYRYYVYAGEQPFTVAADTSVTDSFTINDDADFVARYMSVTSTSPLLRLQLRLTKTNLFNRAVDVGLIAGDGQESNLIPYNMPLWFGRKETVSMDWTDYSGAENKVSLVFVGYEVIRTR
jgi:hypothetical protein